MSANGNDSNSPMPKKSGVSAVLKDVLDFGPDTEEVPSKDLATRVKRVIQKLKDISRRIDELSHNL